jgi:hypothetical protein
MHQLVRYDDAVLFFAGGLPAPLIPGRLPAA